MLSERVMIITVFVWCCAKKGETLRLFFMQPGKGYRTLAKVVSFPMFKPLVNQATANQAPEPLPDGVSEFMRRSKKIAMFFNATHYTYLYSG